VVKRALIAILVTAALHLALATMAVLGCLHSRTGVMVGDSGVENLYMCLFAVVLIYPGVALTYALIPLFEPLFSFFSQVENPPDIIWQILLPYALTTVLNSLLWAIALYGAYGAIRILLERLWERWS
jgi:hypothetical protein